MLINAKSACIRQPLSLRKQCIAMWKLSLAVTSVWTSMDLIHWRVTVRDGNNMGAFPHRKLCMGVHPQITEHEIKKVRHKAVGMGI